MPGYNQLCTKRLANKWGFRNARQLKNIVNHMRMLRGIRRHSYENTQELSNFIWSFYQPYELYKYGLVMYGWSHHRPIYPEYLCSHLLNWCYRKQGAAGIAIKNNSQTIVDSLITQHFGTVEELWKEYATDVDEVMRDEVGSCRDVNSIILSYMNDVNV